MDNEGQVVLVVGGSRGIGRSIAQHCAREGYRTVVSARSVTELEEVAEAVKGESGKTVSCFPCDVTDDAQVRSLVERTETEVGPIYGLVCSAGAYGAIGPFDETPFSDWIEGFELNVFGTARSIHAVAPLMKQRQAGRIILLAGGGQGAMQRFSSYVTSKGAIWRLTETLGAELAPFQIYLNAIAPGAVNTRFLDEILRLGPEVVGQEQYERSLDQSAKGGAPPEKTAELVLYLLSDKGRNLYGKTISANYDRYWEIADARALSDSEVFTMRRVVSLDGSTRYPP